MIIIGEKINGAIPSIKAAIAGHDEALIVERTQAGLAAAKARGATLGRRKKLTVRQVEHGRALLDAGESGHAVAQSLGVSRATLYRALGRTA